MNRFENARLWFSLFPLLLLAALGSGCGGGDPTDQPTTRIQAPSAAVVDPSFCAAPVTGESGSLSYLMVGSSCVNWSQALGNQAIQPERRAHALAAPLPAVDATALMNWAEVAYAEYFPSKQQNQLAPPYVYRYYPETGNYLGVAGTEIYILGPVAGSDTVPAYVGDLANFVCDVLPSSCNAAPVAKAGSAQNVVTGTVVTLDGSASSDANGDALTYAWTLTSRPAGSTAVLSGATSAKPTFVGDAAGTYVATLVVNDGKVSSAAATVPITATVANAAPVAKAGSAQNVVTGTVVTLDGSASSDANGDPLTYAWTLTSRPVGSTAVLSGTTSAKPTFVADAAGTYVATLVVNDGKVSSAAATVLITATVANAAPVAKAGSAQNVVTGTVVTLDGSASSDANGDPLTYAWTSDFSACG